MTLHIDFSPQASARLTEAARSRGIDPGKLLENLVVEHLPAVASPGSPIIFAPTGRAASRLKSRLAAEATDDSTIIHKAQDSLDKLKRSLNTERERSGSEKLF